MVKTCSIHGETEFSKWKCKKCNVQAVMSSRAKVIAILKEEHGGKCKLCGYSKYMGALHFHHLDPKTKLFRLSSGNTPSLVKSRKEASKCVLICGNCHAEVHAGLAKIDIQG